VESAKRETVKLLDMLIDDLGLSEKDIQVFFSGHRGYHIHVEGSLIRELDSVARKEIVDYVIGLGLDTGFLDVLQKGIEDSNNSRDLGLSSYGWKGRVARGVKRIITNAQLEDYETFGIGANAAQILLEKKDKIIKSWETSGFSSHIKGLGPQTLKRLFEASIPLQSSKIDTVVTTDTHRLIRLAGSLHGKTGLRKAEVAISNIDSFDPFKSAVAFEKGETTVLVESAPEFRIGEGTFGPFYDQKVTLPTAAALFLVCKKRAKVVE
jgi:DNA primase small subunit